MLYIVITMKIVVAANVAVVAAVAAVVAVALWLLHSPGALAHGQLL